MIAAMERAYTFISAGLLLVALILFISGSYDGAFVTAALGLISWFLRIRTVLRRSVSAVQDDEEKEEEGSNELDEV